MSDRLDELQLQREIIAQHLAWLDREIAAETRKSGAAGAGTGAGAERIAAPVPVPPSGAGTRAVSVATAADATVATTVNVVTPSVTMAPTAAAASVATKASAVSEADADALMAEYRVAPTDVKNDVRKGCFLYFVLAFVFVGLVVGALWLAFAYFR